MEWVMFPAFRSERFTIAVENGTDGFKLFQLIFSKKDGSVFVNFPYLNKPEGSVSTLSWPADRQGSMDLNLADAGKVTSHLVKYSHHPDGRAHFSQDGKVRSSVKRQSIRLDALRGHMFTVQAHDLSGFERFTAEEDTGFTPKKTLLKYRVDGTIPEDVKITGWWYSIPELQARSADGNLPNEPKLLTQTPDGRVLPAFIVGDPFGFHSDRALLICFEIIKMNSADNSWFIFLGGFDAPEVAYDHSRETGFLAFIYPASEYETLRARLGSIDYAG